MNTNRILASMPLCAALALGTLAGCDDASTTTSSDGGVTTDLASSDGGGGRDGGSDGGTSGATTAVVTTTSFMTSGSLNTVGLGDGKVTAGLDGTLDQDNAVRAVGGKVYVLDRTHGVLRIYDPAHGWKVDAEMPTGDGAAAHETSNPHDVLPIPGTTKVYVALSSNDADHSVGVLDTAQPGKGVVKWIALPKGPTRSPRANNLYLCNGLAYVVLEDLDDQFSVAGPGRMVVLDTAKDAVVADGKPSLITLQGKNPGGGSQDGLAPLDPAGDCTQVLVSNAGDYSKPIPNGGGVEHVDLATRASKGFVVTDEALKGSPGTIGTAGPHLAFVVNSNPDYTNTVVALDPTAPDAAKRVLGPVLGPVAFAPFAQVSPTGKLFVGVARSDAKAGQPAAGLYVGTASSSPLMSKAIDLGQAPYAITFF